MDHPPALMCPSNVPLSRRIYGRQHCGCGCEKVGCDLQPHYSGVPVPSGRPCAVIGRPPSCVAAYSHQRAVGWACQAAGRGCDAPHAMHFWSVSDGPGSYGTATCDGRLHRLAQQDSLQWRTPRTQHRASWQRAAHCVEWSQLADAHARARGASTAVILPFHGDDAGDPAPVTARYVRWPE